MPTIVGILTFISIINTTSESLICGYFSFYELFGFPAIKVEEYENSFITSGPGLYGFKPGVSYRRQN